MGQNYVFLGPVYIWHDIVENYSSTKHSCFLGLLELKISKNLHFWLEISLNTHQKQTYFT